ncbi:hypothetical protein VNO77_23176 [Canavalia gladiata]|uniref:Uncharacterized protein n=1 Tax=Canavalia gladiata TaxID=3824 RepID=A0AAN9QBA2_CANGL
MDSAWGFLAYEQPTDKALESLSNSSDFGPCREQLEMLLAFLINKTMLTVYAFAGGKQSFKNDHSQIGELGYSRVVFNEPESFEIRIRNYANKSDQSQQSLDDKDNIEEHFKHLQLLKKEMEALRNNVLKVETATKTTRNRYDDECKKPNGLLDRFKVADDIRQEEYAKLQALKKTVALEEQIFLRNIEMLQIRDKS